jgi:glycogen operon protein
MLLAGDEFGRSQIGNNNGYCQDSDLSWVHWDGLPASAEALREFTRKLIALRHAQPILRRENWRDGMVVSWLNPGGGEQTEEQWADAGSTTIGLRLERRQTEPDSGLWEDVLILFNPHDGDVSFLLPQIDIGWTVVLETADPDGHVRPVDGSNYVLTSRSLVVLKAGNGGDHD